MVGRDVGTVVLPEADLKIYLDASAAERARRRFDELCARGGLPPGTSPEKAYAEILRSMRRRDQIDSTREVAPLRPAEDAIRVNSDELDADLVLAQVKTLVRSSR